MTAAPYCSVIQNGGGVKASASGLGLSPTKLQRSDWDFVPRSFSEVMGPRPTKL